MTGSLFTGGTTHTRFLPIQHGFEYPLYMMAFPILNRPAHSFLPGLKRNGFGPFSIYESDFLMDSEGALSDKLAFVLDRYGYTCDYDDVRLVTTPRFFKKTFNPISFFYLYSKQELVLIVVEVTNTFHEKHLYFLRPDEGENKNGYYSFSQPKNFYISPFSEDVGRFDFLISDVKETLSVVISYYKDERKEFVATLRGDPQPLTRKNMLKLSARFPFTAALTMPRILYQAGIIHFIKKHKARRKPMATDDLTLKKESGSMMTKLVMSQFRRIVTQMKGDMIIDYPNGERDVLGRESASTPHMKIYTYSFFSKVMESGDIGLGESYMDGDWSTTDLTATLRVFIQNLPMLTASYKGKAVVEKYYQLKHKMRHNSIKNSRKNIQEHYDLGNAFYQLFLDETLSYSCGIFESAQTTLEDAQQAKIDRIIQKLNVGPEHRVLEVGSGWGAMAINLVQQTGCHVTTLTLSNEQFDYVTEQIQALGLQDKIEIKLQDYREHEGVYDRLVSIEMVEAVGHDYIPTYLSFCDKALTPEGIAVIQAITMSDQNYEQYLSKTDFIQQYIFQGGHLPSLTYLTQALTEHTQLMVDNCENIGQHYALTLDHWLERFYAHKETVVEMYSERFSRMWEMYLCYCEAAFRERYIHDVQLVLTKPGNQFLVQQFDKEFVR